MKILQVTASVAPRDGGPSAGIIALNRALNEIGHQARVFSTDADGPRARLDLPTRARVAASGAQVEVFDRSWPRRFKNSWQQALALWQQAGRVDLVHIHGVYLAHSVWAALAARRHHVPYTVQPHGALEPYQRAFGRAHKAVWDAVVGRWVLRGAQALVAASPSEASNLAELLPGVRTVVMPLGVDTPAPRLPPERQAEFAHWLSAPQHQRVLFLGRLAAKKQPDVLVHAFNATSGGTLAVVGPNDDWTAEQLQALVEPSRAQDVTFSSAVDRSGVAWLLREAGIFVLPSLNENFGIAVAEAMHHGCAVITTPETATGELVATAQAGLVVEPTPEAVREALTEVMADPENWRQLAANSETFAHATFRWSTSAATLADSMSATDAKEIRTS